MSRHDWVIAVPNLSGTEVEVASDLAGVLSAESDVDHSRSVLTLGGPASQVLNSCLDLAAWAFRNLDLRQHTGVHPRFGVLDILPLIPYGVEVSALQPLSDELAVRIEKDLGAPVHRYGRADPNERSLPELRRFLRTTPHRSHPTAGVVCLGIRDPLVAFNVNFRGKIQDARGVARSARATEIRALGLKLASRELVQVSMNLIKPERVGPKTAFDRVVNLAKDCGLELVDCEVVGLVPHPILEELEGLPLRKPVRSIEQAIAEKRP